MDSEWIGTCIHARIQTDSYLDSCRNSEWGRAWIHARKQNRFIDEPEMFHNWIRVRALHVLAIDEEKKLLGSFAGIIFTKTVSKKHAKIVKIELK